MPRTVSASEAKNKLGSLMGWVRETHDEVIIESHGEPRVVIMSFTEYEMTRQLREQKRRGDALERMRQLQREVSARNADLAPEQVEELADRFSRDFVDDLAKEGKIKFEQ